MSLSAAKLVIGCAAHSVIYVCPSFANNSSFLFDTESSDFDTELGAYSGDGILLGNDNNGGTSTLSSLDLGMLGAGEYYVLASGFSTSHVNYNARVSLTSRAGNLNVNLNGMSVFSGASAAGAGQVFHFTVIPEPGTFAILSSVSLIGLVVRRRRG